MSEPRVKSEDEERMLYSSSPTTHTGAGTGLVSIVLATLLASKPSKPKCKANIIATDLGMIPQKLPICSFKLNQISARKRISESAMEILETNITNNEQWFPSMRPRAAVLDWDQELPDDIAKIGVDFIMYGFLFRPYTFYQYRLSSHIHI